MEDIAITKVTANHIPMAEARFFDTPMKGHIPKNFERTMLLTNIAPMTK